MQHSFTRGIAKRLIPALALWLALSVLAPATAAARDVTGRVDSATVNSVTVNSVTVDSATVAAARATEVYLRNFAMKSASDNLALNSSTAALSTAPPLPSFAPQLAPAVAPAQEEEDLYNIDEDASVYGENGPAGIGSPHVAETDGDADEADSAEAEDVADVDAGVDDVDTRSTAFVPTDLSMLTEIDMPDEDGRWIRVDLSEQMVIAYEGDQPVRGFIVSTGRDVTPTVTGTFRIRMKVRAQRMVGGSPALGTYYDLDNVQWVQYFYADYGFHGTYWHNNFGHPMSHGCINMTNADAKWLFDWAGPEWDGETIWYAASEQNPGTLVIVHE